MASMNVAGGSDSVQAQRQTVELPRTAWPTVKESPVKDKAAGLRNSRKVEVGVLDKMAGEINQAMEKVGKHIRFSVSVHEASHIVMTKVIDADTGEVVREIPQEKFLDLAANLQKLVGFVIDAEG